MEAIIKAQMEGFRSNHGNRKGQPHALRFLEKDLPDKSIVIEVKEMIMNKW